MYLIYTIVVIIASLAFAVPTYGLSLIAPFALLNIAAVIVAIDDFKK